MLTQILGYLLVGIGLFVFLEPEALKKMLKGKNISLLRKRFFTIGVLSTTVLLAAAFESDGQTGLILLILAMLGIAKMIIFLKPKTTKETLDWYQKQKPGLFRLCSCLHILLGVYILFLTR